MKILCDLDGTLICSKRRLYELFYDLSKTSSVDFDLYWNLKFSGNKNEDILRSQLGFSSSQIDDFLDNWMKNIESDYYLDFDSVIPGVINFLDRSSKENEFYVCTARQSKGQVRKQLKKLAISNYFDEVFVTEQNVNKEELIRKSNISLSKTDWFVGDTGHDVIAGKNLGIKTCAVLSGFMPKSALKIYGPDLILPSITSICF